MGLEAGGDVDMQESTEEQGLPAELISEIEELSKSCVVYTLFVGLLLIPLQTVVNT